MSMVFALLLASAQPSEDPVEAVATTLAAGEEARAKRDYKALRAALVALETSGARPQEANLAAEWRTVLGRLAPPPVRGRALGPAYRIGNLAGGQSYAADQIFLAGKDARVAVSVKGQGTLKLEVSDTKKAILCAHPPRSKANCRWVPNYTQRFEIMLTNAAANNATYYLVVN
jgi:hypothetical protein